jgi:PhnB protein
MAGVGPQLDDRMRSMTATVQISLMLAVEDAPTASDWYQRALGAAELWSLGSVVGLEIAGAPFFLHEPTATGFESPAVVGLTTVRVEVFADDPDAFIARAVAAGADGSSDVMKNHEVPWGVHRQGGFSRSVRPHLACR